MDFEANAQNEEVQSIILKKFDHMPASMSTTIYVVDTEKSLLGAIRELWEMAFGQKAPFYGCKQIKRNMFS